MKAICRYALTLLCMPFLLQAQESSSLQKEDAMIVNSGEAQYDGKEIVLVGQVSVEHGLGQISAHRLSVLPSVNQDKKNKFGFLKIGEDVHIQLKEGGELYCQQAEIDYAKLQGTFLGNEAQPDVVYLNRGEEKGGSQKVRPPLEIKSCQMNFELMREPIPSSSSTKAKVKQVEADQNVRVHYNQDHLLLADHALYQRIPDEKSSIAGLLTLTIKGHLPACKMINLNGDQLSAYEIQLNTVERKLWLSQPVGLLYIRREAHPVQALAFSAKELTWDDQQQNLLLKEQVDVTQNESLHIQTSHELSISQAIVEGKKTLRFLRSPKDTRICYSDVKKDLAHQIYCPGPFLIDHERQEMTMQGLFDPVGEGSQGEQVEIKDMLGEMYADRVTLYYQWQDHQLVPEKMILEGHVRLMNRFDGHRGEAGSILHYALADRVECFHKQQEMLLISGNGNRVLLFDKVNNIQMSAPSLKVRHDSASQKEVIQGLGDVRFTFIEKELEQFKSHFPFNKELKDAKSDKKG